MGGRSDGSSDGRVQSCCKPEMSHDGAKQQARAERISARRNSKGSDRSVARRVFRRSMQVLNAADRWCVGRVSGVVVRVRSSIESSARRSVGCVALPAQSCSAGRQERRFELVGNRLVAAIDAMRRKR